MPMRCGAQARQEPIKECHLVGRRINLSRHVERRHLGRACSLAGDRVVVSSEHHHATDVLRKLVQDSCSDGRPIEGRGPTAKLVEDRQRARRRVQEDRSGFLQLRQQCTLALQNGVMRANPREDPVNGHEAASVCIDAASKLRHDSGNARLPQDGGLAAHVRPSDDQHARHVAGVHRRVVWDEGAAHPRCSNRMSATTQLQETRCVRRLRGEDLRTARSCKPPGGQGQ
mmetsp:Transcript_90140/g.201719  ORF Transcript_90140/g.201719 Transcript_90140/m.201719 type:complete len:228 (+) Transcript_90140:202-885(+)